MGTGKASEDTNSEALLILNKNWIIISTGLVPLKMRVKRLEAVIGDVLNKADIFFSVINFELKNKCIKIKFDL